MLHFLIVRPEAGFHAADMCDDVTKMAAQRSLATGRLVKDSAQGGRVGLG